MAKYDVFISYRRQGGFETALPIVEKLKAAGYRVFFDLESLNSGKFNEQLYHVIDGATDFVIILPEDGMERCQDPEDWVRREAVRALRGGKNIVPVMLKGFEWPADLPGELRELPNYQGISATSPEYFDMAVKRLQGYLKSKPRKPVRRWAGYAASGAAVLLILAAVAWFGFRQAAKPVTVKAGTEATMSMTFIHEMNTVQSDFDRAWELYIEQREKSGPEAQARLDAAFMEDIEKVYIPRAENAASGFPESAPATDYQRFLLGLYDIDPNDVENFSHVVDEQKKGIVENMEIRGKAIEAGMFNTASINSIRSGIKAEEFGNNALYYSYLELLSKLPEEAKAAHKQESVNWHLFPSVSENLTAGDYTRLSTMELTKMKEALKPMETFTEMLSNRLNAMEEYLNDRETELQALEDATGQYSAPESPTSSPEVEAARKRVEAKRAEVAALESEIDNANRALIEQFEGFKSKFEIKAEDDQYLKWGKVLKAANYLGLTVEANISRAQKGMAPAITNAAALDFVNAQLDRYLSHHPDTHAYTGAAKAFYADVAAGKRPLSGMILMGTQYDKPHPLLRTGDIVIERNGRSGIDDFDKYQAASKLAKTGTIVFLRLEGGKLKEHRADMPDTDVNIGLLQLKG